MFKETSGVTAQELKAAFLISSNAERVYISAEYIFLDKLLKSTNIAEKEKKNKILINTPVIQMKVLLLSSTMSFVHEQLLLSCSRQSPLSCSRVS